MQNTILAHGITTAMEMDAANSLTDYGRGKLEGRQEGMAVVQALRTQAREALDHLRAARGWGLNSACRDDSIHAAELILEEISEMEEQPLPEVPRVHKPPTGMVTWTMTTITAVCADCGAKWDSGRRTHTGYENALRKGFWRSTTDPTTGRVSRHCPTCASKQDEALCEQVAEINRTRKNAQP